MFQTSPPGPFTLGTDRTNDCPDGYVNTPNADECFVGYEYLASTDSSKTWVTRTDPRSWSSSVDNPGCVVYLYNGEWDFFYNTGGQLPGLQTNRFPVCSLITPTTSPSSSPTISTSLIQPVAAPIAYPSAP
jgi:hypothetical protein